MDNPKSQDDPLKSIKSINIEKMLMLYDNPERNSLAQLKEESRELGREKWKERFDVIRKAYEIITPRIFKAAKRGGTVNPYFIEWYWSPIEYNAWCEIRRLAIPFYPEYPACGFFLDFADPVKKIGIELDGKEFHDTGKDALRDQKLAADGWKIFRLSGAQANRYMNQEMPKRLWFIDEEGGDGDEMDERRSWDDHLRLTTIDGFFEWLDFTFYHPTHYYRPTR